MLERFHVIVNVRTWEIVSFEDRDPGTDDRIMFPGEMGQR